MLRELDFFVVELLVLPVIPDVSHLGQIQAHCARWKQPAVPFALFGHIDERKEWEGGERPVWCWWRRGGRSQAIHGDLWRFAGVAFFLKKQKGAKLEGQLGQVPTWDSGDAGC